MLPLGRLARLDLPLIATALALAGVGTFAIASATLEGPGTAGLWRMQLIWLAAALVFAAVIITVDYRIWAGIAPFLHGSVLLLLFLVLFFGREIGGNRSWLVFGPFRLQPSEPAKWTTNSSSSKV